MDYDLSPDQEEIRKLARDFADREIARVRASAIGPKRSRRTS